MLCYFLASDHSRGSSSSSPSPDLQLWGDRKRSRLTGSGSDLVSLSILVLWLGSSSMLGQQLLEFTLVVRTRSADVSAQNPTQDPIQTPQGLLSCTMLCLLLFGGRLLERERERGEGVTGDCETSIMSCPGKTAITLYNQCLHLIRCAIVMTFVYKKSNLCCGR